MTYFETEKTGQILNRFTVDVQQVQNNTNVFYHAIKDVSSIFAGIGYALWVNAGLAWRTFFVLPLGVSLPGGVSITVDDGQPVRLRYERCDGAGCVAPLALGQELIAALKGGRWARVAFFDPSGQEISVPVSLLGFTAGFNALR